MADQRSSLDVMAASDETTWINSKVTQNEEKRLNESLILKLKATIWLLILLVFCLTVALIVISLKNICENANDIGLAACRKTSLLKAKYTKSGDLYRELSETEFLKVRDYILNDVSLNITPYENATVNSNYIFLIELQNPVKDDAIAYLDFNEPKPTRAANVILFKGAASPPVIEERIVYFDNPMRQEVNTLLTNKTIPFHARPSNKLEYQRMDEIVDDFGKKVHDILRESYDGFTIVNCTDFCLTYVDTAPTTMFSSNERRSFVSFWRSLNGMYLHPVGLEILMQRQGSDASKWNIEKVFNN